MRKIFIFLIFTIILFPVSVLADDQPVVIISDQDQGQDPTDAAMIDETPDESAPVIAPVKPKVTAAKLSANKRTLYGPTTHNDHIWRLAQKLRPNNSVTVQQMIIALQQANPLAFDQDNINALKHGQMLVVPPLAKIQKISPQLARSLVDTQNKDWQKLPSQPIKKELAVKSPILVIPPKLTVPKPMIAAAPMSAPVAPAASLQPIPPVTELPLAKVTFVEEKLPLPTQVKVNNAQPLVVNKNITKPLSNTEIAATTNLLQPVAVNKTIINPVSKTEVTAVKVTDLQPVIANKTIMKPASKIEVAAATVINPQPAAVNKTIIKPTSNIETIVAKPTNSQLIAINKTVNKVIDKTPTPGVIKNTPVAAATNVDLTIQALQQQLTTTQDDLNAYKEQVNQHFSQLEQQNLTTQSQLSQINQNLSSLSARMITAASKINKVTTQDINATAVVLPSQVSSFLPKSKLGWWVGVFAILLIILLWMPWPQRKTTKKQEPTLGKDIAAVEDDEYDFMNSAEAIPAKFDLARAYMDMDDFISAKQVLKEVVSKGNPSQRKQAKQLLAGMKA